MSWLADLPIERKLRLSMMLISTVVLVLACVVFLANEYIAFRRALAQNVASLARITANTVTAAIAFKDHADARAALEALRAEPQIVAARILDENGGVFAEYTSEEERMREVTIQPGMRSEVRFEAGHVFGIEPVVQSDRQLGTVVLTGSQAVLYRRMQTYTLTVLGVLACAFILAWLLASILQRTIAQPILELARTAGAVSERSDFSLRARQYGSDELGQLTSTFNEMLQRVQEGVAALREGEARMRAVLDTAAEGIITIDERGIIETVNPAAERLFGYNAGELIGRNVSLLMPSPDREAHDGYLQEYLRTGHARIIGTSREVMARRKNGSLFPIELEVGEVHLPGRRVFTGFIRDITERRQAEEQIHQLNASLEQRVQRRTAQLEEANRELEAFSYSVSHDLRAPLRHIDGFTQLLQKNAGETLDTESRRYLSVISESTRRLGALIDDLLVFSRMGRTELRHARVDMRVLVDQVIAELLLETKNRQIEWRIGELPAVIGDAAMLRQVWVNLIGNAVKYTRQREAAVIQVGSRRDKPGELVFFVRDNGAGFDMAYVDKLFGVFQRLHTPSEFEGTGIGLANVRRIVHRHQGRAWAEGRVNEGATIYFSLPDELTVPDRSKS